MARKFKSYRVYKVIMSSFRSPELVSRWKQLQVKEEGVSETFIMSQEYFLNSKDGKNFGSSRGLSGLV